MKALRERGLTHGHVADMSATPFFIKSPKSSLFPRIVSRYGLREAESACIFKIMRLPDTGMDAEMARAICAKTKDRKRIAREDAQARKAILIGEPKALDARAAASKWIRNERLGWTILCLYDGLNRLCEPNRYPDRSNVYPCSTGRY